MVISDSLDELCSVVASAADFCLKPWIHAVIISKSPQEISTSVDHSLQSKEIDLVMKIECRDKEGNRLTEHDLELEVFRSGKELNLMLSWIGQDERPMLWHGKYAIWMDGISGKRCASPDDGSKLESFARRIRTLLAPVSDSNN